MSKNCPTCKKEHELAEAVLLRAEEAERQLHELRVYIDEQRRASEEIEKSEKLYRHAAFHDSLTGLSNRELFTDHLKMAIERAKRYEDYKFAVLFLDLDCFKNINDSLGHNYGDQLLVTIGYRLQACVRQMDTVARFGGDEFAVLLEGTKTPSDAIEVVERIQEQLSVPFKLQHYEAFVTASVGITYSDEVYDEAEEMLRDADTAMYRAKEGGRARYEVFDPVMRERALSLLRLEGDLRRAVERGEFRNFYQPIVSLGTGQLTGFEALVRWQHPERGLVSPAEFIPFAEETGLIVPIGLCVLEEACRQTREWQRLSSTAEELTVSVNLSAKQLSQPDLIEQVESILLKTDFAPHCLRLEITESVVMENAQKAITILKLLRALGVQLSIDDFGTGYSSLSYLYQFPVNVLKIDRSFVMGMSQDRENYEIARTIMMLAKNLNMAVVAEGIETTNQHALLRTLKCEYGQGYLFSRPLEVEAATAYVNEKLKDKKDGVPPPSNGREEGGLHLGSALLM